MNLPINRLQHVGIPVTDLNVSKAFYEKLGFSNVMSSEFTFNGDTGHVIMMQNGDTIIEIYQMPKAELADIRSRKNGHIDHIAFDVSDIDAAYEMIKKEQFEILEDAPVFLPFWTNGCRYFNISGPDGERLEFNQIL